MATTEQCVFVFLWETATACALGGGVAPPGDTDGDHTAAPPGNGSAPGGHMDCAVKDPNSGFVFDLKMLRKQPDEADYTAGGFTVSGPRPLVGRAL